GSAAHFANVHSHREGTESKFKFKSKCKSSTAPSCSSCLFSFCGKTECAWLSSPIQSGRQSLPPSTCFRPLAPENRAKYQAGTSPLSYASSCSKSSVFSVPTASSRGEQRRPAGQYAPFLASAVERT